MAKLFEQFRPVATTLMIAAIVALVGLPDSGNAQNRPAPQVESFELLFQHGDPSFVGFDLPLQSPNLFDIIRRSGIDVDQLLSNSGQSIDWLMTETGTTTDFVLEHSGATAELLLDLSGHTADWLIEAAGKDADWILSQSGKSIRWLLDRTGGTADQLLEWADMTRDMLLDLLDKDADWILDRSGKTISTMLGWTGEGASWVADIVKDVACGSLGGAARSACNEGIDLVADSISELVGKIDRSADWWLDKAGKDIDWLIDKAGKDADWMLSEANKTRTWLWNEIGHDADWLLGKADKTKSWLLTLTGNNVEWLLAGSGRNTNWLFQQIGGTVEWLLEQTHRDADWLLAQIGWRMDQAELTFNLHLQFQAVTGSGIELRYDGASQLQYVPGTPNTPKYDRRVVVLGGNIKAAEGFAATNTSVTVTYKDPTGISVSQGGDVGILNQDLAITIDDGRRILRNTRHSDDWLITFCIPLKLIISAILVEVPPASVAALELVPDVMMSLNGDAGIRFRNEQVVPPMGRIEIITLGQARPSYDFLMQYGSQAVTDAKLGGGSWGFAWGLPCTLGAGISMGYDIRGGQTLAESDPAGIGARATVRFALSLPPDRQPPSRPPPPGPGTPGAVTPVRPPPQSLPAPGTQPVTPQPTQAIEPQTQPQVVQPMEGVDKDKE